MAIRKVGSGYRKDGNGRVFGTKAAAERAPSTNAARRRQRAGAKKGGKKK